MSIKKRVVSIDIIKGIAMLMVILVHYNQSFGAAHFHLFKFCQMGCQMFFVTSGFGIAASMSKRLKCDVPKKAIKDFYLSRIKSIAPAWWIMMVIVYIINTISIKVIGRTLSIGTNRSFMGIICNALFLHGLIPFCNNDVMPGGWYIGTTMLLYALSPLVIILFKKFHPLKVCVTSSLLSIMSVVALLYVAQQNAPQFVPMIAGNNSFGYFSFLSQYPSYALGILLYFYYFDIDSNTVKNKILLTASAGGGTADMLRTPLFQTSFSAFLYNVCFHGWTVDFLDSKSNDFC